MDVTPPLGPRLLFVQRRAPCVAIQRPAQRVLFRNLIPQPPNRLKRGEDESTDADRRHETQLQGVLPPAGKKGECCQASYRRDENPESHDGSLACSAVDRGSVPTVTTAVGGDA